MKTRNLIYLIIALLGVFQFSNAGDFGVPKGDLQPLPPPSSGDDGGSSSHGGESGGHIEDDDWWWSSDTNHLDDENCDPDKSPPWLIFDEEPRDDEVDCPGDAPSAPNATAFDYCDNSHATIIPSTSISTNAAGLPVRIVRTWSASDAAGNSSTWTQMIKICDAAYPTIDIPPEFLVKVDDLTHKGKMPDFRGVARDDRGIESFTQTPKPGGTYLSGDREPVSLVAVDYCGRETTNSTTVIFGCAGCSGTCAPGNGTPNDGSVELDLSLGRLANGRSAGTITLYAKQTND